MLHYKLGRLLTKEYMARAMLGSLAGHGASIHRIGNSSSFELFIPVKAPVARRAALLKVLARSHESETFDLVDISSFEGGPQYRRVTESDLDPITGQVLADTAPVNNAMPG